LDRLLHSVPARHQLFPEAEFGGWSEEGLRLGVWFGVGCGESGFADGVGCGATNEIRGFFPFDKLRARMTRVILVKRLCGSGCGGGFELVFSNGY
jgi:hypothetical protein